MIAESTTPNKARGGPAVEAVLLYAALMALFKGLLLAGDVGRVALGYAVPLGFVYAPLLVLHLGRRDFDAYGLRGGDWRQGVRVALVAAAVLIPGYVLAVRLLPAIVLGREAGLFWDLDIAKRALLQLLAVALPEELFFRGYLQTRLGEAFARRRRVFGTPLSVPAVVVTSALFALGHFLTQPHPARLLVFFPSLVFGWMRERTGSIVASTLFHGLANITVLILFG